MFCVTNYTDYMILFNTHMYLYICEIRTSTILIFFILKFENLYSNLYIAKQYLL